MLGGCRESGPARPTMGCSSNAIATTTALGVKQQSIRAMATRAPTLHETTQHSIGLMLIWSFIALTVVVTAFPLSPSSTEGGIRQHIQRTGRHRRLPVFVVVQQASMALYRNSRRRVLDTVVLGDVQGSVDSNHWRPSASEFCGRQLRRGWSLDVGNLF